MSAKIDSAPKGNISISAQPTPSSRKRNLTAVVPTPSTPDNPSKRRKVTQITPTPTAAAPASPEKTKPLTSLERNAKLKLIQTLRQSARSETEKIESNKLILELRAQIAKSDETLQSEFDKLKRDYNKLSAEHIELQQKHTDDQKTIKTKKNELIRLSKELTEAKDMIHQYGYEKPSRKDNSKNQSLINTSLQTLEKLNKGNEEDIKDLRRNNLILTNDYNRSLELIKNAEVNEISYQKQIKTLEESARSLKQQNESNKESVKHLQIQSESNLSSLQYKLQTEATKLNSVGENILLLANQLKNQ